ncbi:hypothetical protein NMY22_g16460 [Coprinellus aureogranulatus]|nr:hypothetical protein NMY22_g16460 [Coprinellus aureogranulatus]
MESLINACSHRPVDFSTSVREESLILALEPENSDNLEVQLKETEGPCPIRHIPEEILGEIFMFAQALVEDNTPGSMRYRERLIDLCLVCKRWLQTAIEMPSLWATVEISRHSFNKTVSSKVEQWLNRARALPKTLEFDTFCNDCFSSCDLSSVHLANFLTRGPILKRLSISCRGWECIINLLVLLDKEHTKRGRAVTPWNATEDLCIDLLDGWYHGMAFSHSHFTTIYSLLPKVTSFELAYSHCDLEPDDLILPLYIPKTFLANLTRLSLYYGDVANFSNVLPVLKACHLVEDLCLCLGDKTFLVDESLNPSSHCDLLPRMRRLKLRVADMQCLQHFCSPMLEELDIGSSGTWDHALETGEEAIGRHVQDFIDRSQRHTNLRCLKMQWMGVRTTTLACLLRQLPGLCYPTLDEVAVDPSLFLTLAEGHPPALPLLNTLELENLLFPAVCARDYIRARRDLVQGNGTPVVRTQLKIGDPSFLYSLK